jgi:predicted nucleic acid-binding protein
MRKGEIRRQGRLSLTPLIIDTTYILPLFGIDVHLSPGYEKKLKIMWKKGISGYKLVLPASCLVEVYYKLNREYKQEEDITILDRYSLALPTILTSKLIHLFDPVVNHDCSQFVAKIRSAGHPDVLDCFIAATALSLNGYFLTEDGDLSTILSDNGLLSPDKLLDWKGLLKRIL